MSSPAGTDVDPGIDEPPGQASTLGLWALLLAGPVLWMSHFMAVYLFAEAACVARDHEGLSVPGSGAIVPAVVVATVAFGAATAAATVAAWRAARRSEGDRSVMAWAGTLLGLVSVVAILAVGLPALGLEPC